MSWLNPFRRKSKNDLDKGAISPKSPSANAGMPSLLENSPPVMRSNGSVAPIATPGGKPDTNDIRKISPNEISMVPPDPRTKEDVSPQPAQNGAAAMLVELANSKNQPAVERSTPNAANHAVKADKLAVFQRGKKAAAVIQMVMDPSKTHNAKVFDVDEQFDTDSLIPKDEFGQIPSITPRPVVAPAKRKLDNVDVIKMMMESGGPNNSKTFDIAEHFENDSLIPKEAITEISRTAPPDNTTVKKRTVDSSEVIRMMMDPTRTNNSKTFDMVETFDNDSLIPQNEYPDLPPHETQDKGKPSKKSVDSKKVIEMVMDPARTKNTKTFDIYDQFETDSLIPQDQNIPPVGKPDISTTPGKRTDPATTIQIMLDPSKTRNSKTFDIEEPFDTVSLIPEEKTLRKIGADIEIIDGDIRENDQQYLIDKLFEMLSNYPDDKQGLAMALKLHLEEQFGYVWHVILTDESVWLEITHVKNYFLHIRMGTYSYLMWMSSD